ncbi:MAG: LysM peptidoglycan-binding domain-containing protein [Bacteroidota bacterium]
MNFLKTNPLILVIVIGCFLLAPFSVDAQQATSRHLVVYGQTLSKIARMYGMTVAELKTLNKLTSDGIYPNKELLVIDRLNNQSQATQVDRGLSQSQIPDIYTTPQQVTRGPAPTTNTNMGSGIRYKDLTTYEQQRNYVNRGIPTPAAQPSLDNLLYQPPAQSTPNTYRSREDYMLDQISRSPSQGYDPYSQPNQQSYMYPSRSPNQDRNGNVPIFSPTPTPSDDGSGLDPDFLKKLNSINNTSDNGTATGTSTPGAPILKSKYYRVLAGENIYDVAVKFEVSVEQIKLWNGVNDVRQDDVVIVGKYYGDYRTAPGFGYNEGPRDNLRLGSGNVGRGGAAFEDEYTADLNRGLPAKRTIEDPYLDYPGNISTYKYQPERNSARYVEYGSFIAYEAKMPGAQNLYALHKYLQPGSTVKVEVPGNDKDVEVTIVGYLPAEEDAIIALSPAAIQALGPHQYTIRIKY